MMDFDLKKMLKERTGDIYDLHARYINKQFVKVVKTIGFDKAYTRANGYYLYDKDNKRYIDFITGYGVFALGRNHPVIVKAIMDFIGSQAPHLLKMDCAVVSGLAAERLIKIAPNNLKNVFFTNSGSESVDTAMKYAKCFTKRDKFVFLEHAFHGLTIGPLSVNGNIEFKDGFGKLLDGCIQVPFNNLGELESALKNNDVAAFIFEPIQGKGVYLPDDDYFSQAETLCRKYGTLMIADEIQTGCGRTGKFFAFEHFGITPDIVTLSKALSGGMIPVGAVLSRQDIHDSVFSKMDRCVVHSSTFSQNGLAMAAVLATLHVIESENILDNVIHLERIFMDGLNQHRKKYDIIKEVRGKGVMIILSDFFIKEGYQDGLRLLVWHGFDIFVMQVLSPQEINPPITGDLRLKDIEDGDMAEVTISAPLLKRYKANLAAYTDQLRQFCARREIMHLTVSTETEIETLIIDYMRKKGLLR